MGGRALVMALTKEWVGRGKENKGKTGSVSRLFRRSGSV